jgi:hypothetical protein
MDGLAALPETLTSSGPQRAFASGSGKIGIALQLFPGKHLFSHSSPGASGPGKTRSERPLAKIPKNDSTQINRMGSIRL